MTVDPLQLFTATDGLFADVEMIPCTPVEQIQLAPAEIHYAATQGGEHVAPIDHDPKQVRQMFTGLGWSTTTPSTTSRPTVEDWRNRHDPRNDDERPDLTGLPRHTYTPMIDCGALSGAGADLSRRWPSQHSHDVATATHAERGDLDLFATAPASGLCDYGTLHWLIVAPKPGDPRPCSRPATHGARAYTPADEHHDEHRAAIDCCLDHANYYAEAWCPIYPTRDAAWLDILPTANERTTR